MTITQNTTAIIPINNQKGIDGSTSIPTIQDGYCINMENVDLSTSMEIKKRRGYAKYCSEFPVRASSDGTHSVGKDKVYPSSPVTRSVKCTVMEYDAAGLAFLDAKLGYQSFRDVTKTSGYSIAYLTEPNVGRYGMIEDHECYSITGSGVNTYRPIKVLSNEIMIIRHYAAGSRTLLISETPSLRNLKKITQITDLGSNVLKIFTTEAVSLAADTFQIFEPLLGLGTITSVVLGEYFTVSFSVSTTSIPVSLMKFYVATFPRRVERNTGYEVNTTTEYINIFNETYVEYSPAAVANQAFYFYGSGFEVFPNALETYFSYADQVDKLVAIHNGRIYDAPYPELRYDVSYNMAYPTAIAVSQILAKNQGRYRITYNLASSTYQVNDIIKLERQNSDTGIKTYFSMVVSAVDATGMYVIADESDTVPTSLLVGEVLHWTRYTQSIALSASVIGSDSVILIDGVSVHEVSFSNGTEVLFDTPILISSKSTIQLFDYWTSSHKGTTAATYDLQEHFQIHQRGVDSVLGSSKFSYGSYFTDPVLGIQRYDGYSRFSLSMESPVVIGKRSIPGSIGVFPVVTGGNNKKVGDPINTVFTFVHYDNNGFTSESDYSDPSSGYIVPNAALDGGDYLELVEYKIQAPTVFPTKGVLYLNAYVSVVENQTNTNLAYLLYKTVKVYDSNEINYVNSATYPTGGVELSTIIMTVGEIPGSAFKSAPELPALTSPSTVVPKSKYLLSAGNRIVALNTTSFPYFKLEVPTTLFYNNQFTAFCALTINGDRFFTAPLGVLLGATYNLDRLIKDQTEATLSTITSADNFYPLPDNYSVFTVDYKNTNIAKNSFSITYGNPCNTFGSTTSVTYSVDSKRAVLRQCQPILDLKGNGIDLTGSIFDVVPSGISNTIAFKANTAWTNTNLYNGIPRILGEYGTSMFAYFLYFEQVTKTIGGAVYPLISTNDNIYVTASTGGSNNPIITLYIQEAGFKTADWGFVAGTMLHDKLITIHGINDIFNFALDVNSAVLSTDSEIVWLSTYIEIYPTSAAASASNAEYKYKLTPYLVTKYDAATEVTTLEKVQLGTLAAGSTQGMNTTIEVFQYPGVLTISGDTITTAKTMYLTGFSNPSNIVQVDLPIISTMYEVGNFCTFEIDRTISLPTNFPRLQGTSHKVISNTTIGGAFSRLVLSCVCPVEFGSSTTITLGATSYLVNTSKLFTVSMVNSLPYFSFYALDKTGAAVTASSLNSFNFGFMIVRGREFNTCCMELSGPIKLHVKETNSISDKIRFLVPYTIGSATTDYYQIDYSKITGVSLSCFVASATGYPVPVPRRLTTDSNYADLALPLASVSSQVAEDPFVQVVKRFEMMSPYFKATGSDKYTSDLKYNEAICALSEPPSMSATYVTYATGVGNVLNAAGTAFKGYNLHGVISGNIGSAALTLTPANVDPRRDNRGNTIYWTNSIAETNADAAILPAFKYNNQKALNTEDDSDITGAVTFQGGLLIFKKNSVWRMTFNDDDTPSLTRVQSTVGTLSPNSIVANNDVCYFVNDQGIYYTDGTKVYHELRMNRHFNNYVDKSDYKFRRCAGFSDMEAKNINIGLDYYSPYHDKLSTQVEGQAVYCYNDGVLGWSVNSHIPSIKWVISNHNFYFINSTGNVCKVRNENSLTKFRDGEQAIPMNIKTRYLTSEDTYRFKFYRNFLFQFGDTTSFNMEAYYAIDFKTYEHPLEIYPQEKAATFNGIITYGTEKYMKVLRETMAQRVANVSIRLSENTTDTDATVYGIAMEGWLHNTTLVSQKTTPGGSTRT